MPYFAAKQRQANGSYRRIATANPTFRKRQVARILGTTIGLQEWQVLDGDLPFPARLTNAGFVPQRGVLRPAKPTLIGRSPSNC